MKDRRVLSRISTACVTAMLLGQAAFRPIIKAAAKN
jgi:hypothetical protein